MRVWISIFALFAVLAMPHAASARNTEVILPVQGALDSEVGDRVPADVKFYMKGQRHAGVSQEISTLTTNQSTRGAFRSDEASCQVAFISALRKLGARAQEQGGNAVINIVSVTRGKTTESASDFRCVAGSMVVHVGLRGTLVKLK